jgi:hypothetical protein
MLESTHAWSYLILIKPTIHYGSVAYSSNLLNFTCQIKFFSSLSPTWKVIPLLSTWWLYSTPKRTPFSLPQGALLSTTLFSLYLSDTHLTIYAFDIALLSHSWWPDAISRRSILLKYLTTWQLRLNTHKTVIILFSKPCPRFSDPFEIQDTFVPWASGVRYLGLTLYSKLLFTWHLHAIANRATGVFCNIFPLLAWDSALTHPL